MSVRETQNAYFYTQSSSGGAPTQAQIDAAVAANPAIATKAELNAEIARIAAAEAKVTALETSQTTQDTQLAAVDLADNGDGSFTWTKPDGSTQTIQDSELMHSNGVPPNPAPATREICVDDTTDEIYYKGNDGNWHKSAGSTGPEADPLYIADKPAIDAHLINTELHLPQTNSANQYVKRNAAGDGWETVDLPITPENLKAHPGIPTSTHGNDGDYSVQIDAALGANDIWGPKAAGAWPAQADFRSADPEVATQAQAESTTGLDYTTPRIWSTENVDQWGMSRRVDQIFEETTSFDFRALGYPPKTAVFIRNKDKGNGINITFGVGGSHTIVGTNADGSDITGTDFFNLQPSEFVVIEDDIDGVTVRASIIPAERVKNFNTYALANAFGALPHDGIVLIKSTKEVWGRTSATNGVLFPADGIENADWGIFGGKNNFVKTGTTAEKVALGIVPANTPFFDTDLGKLQYYKTSSENFTVNKAATDLPYLVEWASANSVFSNMQFKIATSATETTDNSVINLPDGQDVLLYIIGRQFFNGTQAANTLGGAFTVRNDNGVLTLVSIEPNRYWGGGLDYTTMSYTDFPNLVTSPIGISISDVNAIFTNIASAGIWTNLDGTITQSQALEDFKPLTAYATGERFVAPMPLNADFIDTNGAIFNVDYIFEANTDIPNTIAAFDEAQADSGNYDLVGVFRVSGTQDRVLTGTGIMAFDPLTTLSNSAKNEFIHWTTTDTPKDILFTFNPSFITIWKDYTGNALVQPTNINDTFTIPAHSQMWVHRTGNAIQIVFQSNEGGESSPILEHVPGEIVNPGAIKSYPRFDDDSGVSHLYQAKDYNGDGTDFATPGDYNPDTAASSPLHWSHYWADLGRDFDIKENHCQNLVWKDLVLSSLVGNSIKKGSGIAVGFNSGATGEQVLKGDFSVDYVLLDAALQQRAELGLSTSPQGQLNGNYLWSVSFNANQAGWNDTGTLQGFGYHYVDNPNTIVRLRRINDTCYVFVKSDTHPDWTLQHTFTTKNTENIYINCSIYTPDAEIGQVRVAASDITSVDQQDNGDGTYLEDRGIFREQWGVTTTSGGITFPFPFKTGSVPVVTAVPLRAGDNLNITLQSVNNLSFGAWIVRNESDVGVTGISLHWVAKGLKP